MKYILQENEKYTLNEADDNIIAHASTGELGNILLNDPDLSSKNWQAYFEYYWKDYKDVFERIGTIFYKEVIKYGFDENHNPFIKYLNTILGKIPNNNITFVRYGAIHNAVGTNLTLRDLVGTGFFEANNIIFTNGYYTATEQQCPGYLELQHKMEETLRKWNGELEVKDDNKNYKVNKLNALSAFSIDYSNRDNLAKISSGVGDKFLPLQQARTSFYILFNQKPEENDDKDNKQAYEAKPFIQRLVASTDEWEWLFAIIILKEIKTSDLKGIVDLPEYINNKDRLIALSKKSISGDQWVAVWANIDRIFNSFDIKNKKQMIIDLLKYFDTNKK